MIHCALQPRKEANHGNRYCSTRDTARAFGDSAAVTDPGRIADPTRIADPRRSPDSGGITPNGDGPMMTSSAARDRFPGGVVAAGGAGSVVDVEADAAEAGLERRVRGYQRKFRNRSGVLNEVVRVHRMKKGAEKRGRP
jgi:hypothetical protein